MNPSETETEALDEIRWCQSHGRGGSGDLRP